MAGIGRRPKRAERRLLVRKLPPRLMWRKRGRPCRHSRPKRGGSGWRPRMNSRRKAVTCLADAIHMRCKTDSGSSRDLLHSNFVRSWSRRTINSASGLAYLQRCLNTSTRRYTSARTSPTVFPGSARGVSSPIRDAVDETVNLIANRHERAGNGRGVGNVRLILRHGHCERHKLQLPVRAATLALLQGD